MCNFWPDKVPHKHDYCLIDAGNNEPSKKNYYFKRILQKRWTRTFLQIVIEVWFFCFKDFKKSINVIEIIIIIIEMKKLFLTLLTTCLSSLWLGSLLKFITIFPRIIATCENLRKYLILTAVKYFWSIKIEIFLVHYQMLKKYF